MRITDIIIYEDESTKQAILDYLAVMAGEGLDSVSLDTLKAELNSDNISIDKAALFDILDNIDIVRNIKDDVVFFNTDSDASKGTPKVNPEKDNNVVDKMARKQVDKELNK